MFDIGFLKVGGFRRIWHQKSGGCGDFWRQVLLCHHLEGQVITSGLISTNHGHHSAYYISSLENLLKYQTEVWKNSELKSIIVSINVYIIVSSRHERAMVYLRSRPDDPTPRMMQGKEERCLCCMECIWNSFQIVSTMYPLTYADRNYPNYTNEHGGNYTLVS